MDARCDPPRATRGLGQRSISRGDSWGSLAPGKRVAASGRRPETHAGGVRQTARRNQRGEARPRWKAGRFRRKEIAMAMTKWGRKESIIWPPHSPIYTYGAVFMALVITGLFLYESLCSASKGIWSACSAVYRRIPAFHKCSVMCTFTVVYLHDPIRGGVSKFFRCEAPFLLRHEIEWTIMLSLRAQKPWTPPRPQASLSAAPSHHCSGLFAHAKRGQPAWRVPSSGSPGSHGPLRRHS